MTYATPPDQGEKKGRDAFAGNVRSYEDGFAAGWCEGVAEMMDGRSHVDPLIVAVGRKAAERRGCLDLLRAECRKRGVDL